MRRTLMARLLGVIIAVAGICSVDADARAQTPAQPKPGTAAGQPPAGQSGAPGNKDRADGSPLAGFSFGDKPFYLNDDGTYLEFMQRVGRDIGRGCRGLEAYGWIIKGAEADKRMDGLIRAGSAALRKVGFKVKEVRPKSVQSDEILVLTADAKERRLMVVWSAIREGLILLICDAGK